MNELLDKSYYHPKESEVLQDYLKAVDMLTIDPTQRLQQENQELKAEKEEEIEALKADMKELKLLISWVGQGNDVTPKQQQEEQKKVLKHLQDEVGYHLQKEYYEAEEAAAS